MAETPDNFLGRWSQRKQLVRQGASVPAEPAPDAKGAAQAPLKPLQEGKELNHGINNAQAAINNVANTDLMQAQQVPPPSLQDAQALTTESDFKPFIAKNVAPEVKNAAMRKLFADPHFNVMDMMDVYVDDYSKSDPIPPEMLREMVASKFLKLFERDEEPVPPQVAVGELPSSPPSPPEQISDSTVNKDPQPREGADTPTHEPVAHSLNRVLPNDHTDLQLQPNHAPGREGAGRSAG